MNQVKCLQNTSTILFLIGILSCSQAQVHSDQRLAGGACEGCEAVFEYGDRELKPVDTLPGFDAGGPKLKITGTIYQLDGETPAEGVIMYVYHTNQDGVYQPNSEATGWARHHGKIHGWIRTDKDGSYGIYTTRPAPYPSRSDPAHIHTIILEPDGQYYWVESFHFAGDRLLNQQETDPEYPRGGTSGVLTLTLEDGLHTGRRDLILGANIPDYR